MLKTRTTSFLAPNHLPLRKLNFQTQKEHHQTLTEKLLSLIKQCKFKNLLKQIHTQMLINSIPKPNFLLSKIVELKDLAYASLVFNQLTKPNIYAFNVMLRGLAATWKKYDFCVELYYKLKSLGLKANNFTYTFLFIAYGNVWGSVHGKIGHCLVFKTGLDGDEYVNHSLITMYARCGEMGSARKVFDEMGDRGLVSWNSMISGYSKMDFAKEAIRLFMEMREEGFEPDEMTLVSVLGACEDLGDLGLGRWVDWFVLDKKMELNSYVGSALIDMYGKCGDLISARRVFDSMPNKDVVTWNAFITGCAQNGASNEAIVLFKEMREADPNPDKVTMIEVLSACSTLGALDLGKWVETHASERGLQHDVHVANVGERVIELFLEMELSNSGNYVISSKIYANMKRWDDCAKMRVLTRQCGVSKTPGCSWIDIGARVHEFHAGDSLHHHLVIIYHMLNEEMKREGYIPNTDCI
ncbi:hypothetical protein OIU79_003193 [Salix purpurea]|uniref:Chlororespiratory reduction 4 n=1 Tax=Salix purpurea TaxID=77065 RepID=A0A9Q0ZEX4_SALPP|nr:hypothetical protein OIU79_003193 [Salix purpurea]